MDVNAESLKKKLRHLNEYKKPIFKIHNDPRYTRIGKYLANSGLDELPQLINILRGEMDFIGPRPLPVSEAMLLSKKYDFRYSVLPGIIPPWIKTDGSALTTNKWLELEKDYIRNKSFFGDILLSFKTVGWIIQHILRQF